MYLLITVGTLFIIFKVYTFVSYQYEVYKYNENIQILQKSTTRQISDIASSSDSNKLVYFGRPSCPYCRAFVPKLRSAVKKTHVEVKYIQTNPTTGEKSMDNLRSRLNIEYVPTLIRIKNGKVTKYNEKEDLNKFLLEK